MDRRTVIAGAAAVVAAAALPSISSADDLCRLGRIAQFADKPYPDDMEQWPEIYRTMAKDAFRRFQEGNPNAKPVSECSECVTVGDPRFEPYVMSDGRVLNFALVYTVEFDRPVWGSE